MYTHVRCVRIDAGPLAAARPEHVADRVFDAQRYKVETFDRRFNGGHVHAQGALDRKHCRPVERMRGVVNVLIAAGGARATVAGLAHTP